MTAGSNRGARLLADIGGTNARFGWQAYRGAEIRDVRVLLCAQYANVDVALRAYLQDSGHAAPAECAIAIATPVLGDQVSMTNHPWQFSIAGLKQQFDLHRLLVLNDFTALALALPALDEHDVRQIGPRNAAAPGTAIGLIGPGTGLGVSGLVPDGRGGWVPLQGEGGHVTLPASTPREQAVLARLAAQHGHVSAERAVSGQGLSDLYRALCAIDGAASERMTPDEVTHGALASGDPRSREALNLFCAFLGTVAGNLALTLGARGGIYIGGGIVPRLGSFFDASPFRERFEAKGRFATYLANVPTFIIQAAQSPALLGAARALDDAIA